MAKVYRLYSEGKALPMQAVSCKNEESELQDLLERAPDLLAGEQIDPEDPRRWLLIKREMDIPDPVSGASRWSVDFLYVDQGAVLTFVECKRHNDTRSRREVIGQVLDYAANAYRLWTADQLKAAATHSAQALGSTLDAAVMALGSEYTTESLFDAAMANLQQSRLRIILFLEAAPPELKTLVEFLNKELSNAEVCLVEAKLYQDGDVRVVSPTLWGYTEEVRLQKATVAAARSGGRKRWDEPTFFAELARRLESTAGQDAVTKLYQALPQLGYAVSWGSGQNGSVNISLPGATDHAMLSVLAEGDILVNLGSLSQIDAEEPLREDLANLLQEQFGWRRPTNYPKCYPRIRNTEWAPKIDGLLVELGRIGRLRGIVGH